MNTQTFWRKCSSCKKEIGLNSKYYECSVSTCTGQRTGYVFCSISCWEVHLPGAKHRDAGAIEKKSPMKAEPSETSNAPVVSGMGTSSSSPQRRIIVGSSNASGVSLTKNPTVKSAMSNEVLVVVSKMKQYIRDLSEMNTSEEVNQILSDIIRTECEKAITSARAEGRKTVMARDFKKD
ncbi:MAG: hypothetical protein K0R29_372 [Pseudobdellovibrio sp.]|jgi:hypothetical protein|nr:hypothetical protein [Pseudobdellovibrio sp.]